MRWRAVVLMGMVLAGLPGALGCSSSAPPVAAPQLTDAAYQAKVLDGMHTVLLADIDALLAAAKDLKAAAPTPTGRGWSATDDGAALDATKAAWFRARSAYEHSEGAIAPLFPDIDRSIDARYDDFLAVLGSTPDTDLFDGTGVTGMHALERILWADTAPSRVVTFESALPGYSPAAFPATDAQAAEFQSGLCEKLITDVTTLRAGWQPVHIHIFIAFEGLVALMNEQREKVRKAASNEEESRYSQRTMTDIRDNLAGTKAVFALFEPWLVSKKGGSDAAADGPAIDAKIQAGFQALADAYGQVSGDRIPTPPATWSSEAPSAADLATPFGKLYSEVDAAVDPNVPSSAVAQMNDAARVLGFPLPGM